MKEKICPVCEKVKLIPADDIVSEVDGYVFVEKESAAPVAERNSSWKKKGRR